MTYIRDTKRAHLDALRIRQQIAAAEVAKAERELAELREVEHDLARLERRKEIIAAELQRTRERTTTARQQLALPAPIYGGKEGLEAAAREVAGWWSRKQKETGRGLRLPA